MKRRHETTYVYRLNTGYRSAFCDSRYGAVVPALDVPKDFDEAFAVFVDLGR